MVTRARKMPSDEDGFIIIEVLVSALILAIVAGAVLTLITATTRGAAVQRDSSVGYDVAQADQARMRMLKLTEINGVETKERTETRNGTVYTVKSERVFVNNKTATATCASSSSKPDYVQLTSTVSSSSMVQPVVLQSVVSPSSGSLDENNGTLTVKTANAKGEPLPGITVTATSATAGTRTATTGAEGCANFVSVPAGTYELTYNGNGLVNTKGETKTTTPEVVSLAAGEYKTVPPTPSLWDHPATITPKFSYLNAEGKPVTVLVESMYVANVTNGVEGPVGTPGIIPTSSLSKVVFPFKSPGEYTVFAGYCSSNNPGTANKLGLFSGVVAPEANLRPEIRLPKLELTVTTKSGKEGKEGTEQLVSGAKVTLTDRNCKYSGSNITRTYTTNSSGHILEPTVLPYGAYSVCASATINKELRKVTLSELKVEDFTSKGTALKLNLATGSGAC